MSWSPVSVLWLCFTSSVLCWLLYYVTRALITKYQTGCLRIQRFIILWFWRPEVQSQGASRLVSFETSCLGLPMGTILLPLLVIFDLWRNSLGVSPDAMISSYKDTSHIGLGPTLKISFSLTYLMVLGRNLDTLRDTKDVCTQRRECGDVANGAVRKLQRIDRMNPSCQHLGLGRPGSRNVESKCLFSESPSLWLFFYGS